MTLRYASISPVGLDPTWITWRRPADFVQGRQIVRAERQVQRCQIVGQLVGALYAAVTLVTPGLANSHAGAT